MADIAYYAQNYVRPIGAALSTEECVIADSNTWISVPVVIVNELCQYSQQMVLSDDAGIFIHA